MIEALFIGSFLLLVVLRLPIAFALGASSLVWLLASGTSLTVVPHVMTTAFDSFVLLAIPLFMLAGALMNSGGITERLFGFASRLVGHIKGGLGHVNVVASIVFAGMSGSAVADSAGLGQLEIKAMRKEGFDPEFSAAVTAASSTIGPIIPPSIPLVIYGMTASTSVGALFLGGTVPGLLMALMLMIAVYLIAARRNYPVRARATALEILKSFGRAMPPLLTPIIIVGGIASGMFTPTEAAAVAVIYSLALGTLVYRETKPKDLRPLLIEVARLSAAILIILSAASLFSYVLTYSGLAGTLTKSLLGLTTNKYLMLLIINVMLLVVGCFMEPVSVLLILVPLLLPIVDALGIDRVHFGVVAVLNLMIGLITPPVGVCLYVTAKIANISFDRAVRATLPFLAMLILSLMIVTYVPLVVTFLPDLLLK
jgi:tripartite ATP-independent transporter DctM subunit